MRKDKNGGFGFPEAVMAMMVVSLALTAYLGFFASSAAAGGAPSIDRGIADGVSVVSGSVSGDLSDDLRALVEKRGYRGASVRCYDPCGAASGSLEFSTGSMDGRVYGERFLRAVPSDDGRAIPLVFEAAVCA
ncbi:MAG: hypothetical protein LBG62_07380 [Candidatus Methanoplasma sp.]|jgi:hypothetical protein|nr:hypothetical protein [Candidatus Methanoplasma sp.]